MSRHHRPLALFAGLGWVAGLAIATLGLSPAYAQPPSAEASKLPSAEASKSRPVEKLTDFRTLTIEGFTVRFNEQVISKSNEYERLNPIALIGEELQQIAGVVPAQQLQELRRVQIWVEWDRVDSDNPQAVAVYRTGTGEAMRLKGLHPQKAGAIEVVSLYRIARSKRQAGGNPSNVLLHELAHAYHDRVLGIDNQAIRAAYKQAMERKLYEQVRDFTGRKLKAYATTNEYEYFAELSEAYLFKNDFYPFERLELSQHDPIGYTLMEQAWGTLTNANRLAKVKTLQELQNLKKGTSPTPSASDAATEKLTIAKHLLLDGSFRRARQALQELIREHPKSEAARQARELLEAIP
jgi:TolA-binding protein